MSTLPPLAEEFPRRPSLPCSRMSLSQVRRPSVFAQQVAEKAMRSQPRERKARQEDVGSNYAPVTSPPICVTLMDLHFVKFFARTPKCPRSKDNFYPTPTGGTPPSD